MCLNYLLLAIFFSTVIVVRNENTTKSLAVPDANAILQALKNDTSLDSLVCAVESIILTEGLVIVVSASPDPSLIIPTLNYSFEHLTHPTSLKASIFQLVSRLTDALRNSDNHMYKISLLLKKLDLKMALEALDDLPDPDAAEVLTELGEDLKKSASECLTLANETENDFVKVLNITEELTMSCINRKSFDNDTLVELGKANISWTELKNAKVEKRKRDEADLREMRENAMRLQDDLLKEENEGVTFGFAINDWLTFPLISVRWVINVNKNEMMVNKNERLLNEKKKLEERRKEFEQNEESIANFTAMIKNINLESMDLSNVIKFIGGAVDYLTLLRNKWSDLTNYFQKISILIDVNIAKQAENIKNITSTKKYKLKRNSALLVQIAIISQKVVGIAEKYNRLCEKHVNPMLAQLHEGFQLNTTAATVRKNSITTRLDTIKFEISQEFYVPKTERIEKYIIEKTIHGCQALARIYDSNASQCITTN